VGVASSFPINNALLLDVLEREFNMVLLCNSSYLGSFGFHCFELLLFHWLAALYKETVIIHQWQTTGRWCQRLMRVHLYISMGGTQGLETQGQEIESMNEVLYTARTSIVIPVSADLNRHPVRLAHRLLPWLACQIDALIIAVVVHRGVARWVCEAPL
jgi:hypothetical protein